MDVYILLGIITLYLFSFLACFIVDKSIMDEEKKETYYDYISIYFYIVTIIFLILLIKHLIFL